jgi:protein-disulfide isomerase
MRTLLLSSLCLFLASCTTVDTTGVQENSTKTPRGTASASVIVTEYGDFQCPACAYAHKEITTPLLAKYDGNIRFDFRQFPLRSIHPYALPAAQASECAADQGKFWEFFDHTYEHQDTLAEKPYIAWATELGLNVDLFTRCIDSGMKKSVVLEDLAMGEKVGVNSTPSYFVNGELVRPNTLEHLSKKIDEALAKAKNAPL